MKRFFLLLLTILLLTGCGTNPPDVTQPTTETEPTAATLISWVEDAGMDWDRDGILKEIPLTIPDGLHYSSAMEFDGDLLLWSVDNHLADTQFVEMCLIELDTGSIIAQEDVAVSGYAYPQVAGDILYICDTEGDSNLKLNTILKLNKSLNITDKWSIGDLEGLFYMSANGTIYHLRNEDNLFFRHDSETGEALPVLEGNPTVDWVQESDGILTIRYYDLSTGAPAFAIVDLHTEAIYLPQTDEQIDTLRWKNGTWLYEKYLGYYIYYIQNGDAQPLRFMSEDRSLNLLPRSEILAVDMNGGTVSLYQLDGTHISTCEVFENGSGYVDPNLIWNDTLGGYFMLANSYDETFRLLFWDLSQSLEGENLVLEQIPEPDQIQTALEEKADTLEQKYGLTILVGEQCDTQYDDFSATLVTDWDKVSAALDTLDEALSVYPDNFIRQLRWDSIHGIQVQLISDLQADGNGRTGGGYNAFTQPQWGYYLMVMDIDASDTDTYYHEMSHIIDSYLQWDSENREGSIYSERTWNSLNPGWFGGYTHDYSWEQNLQSDGWFIDGYATISPTEDRARLMEYAMVPWGEWMFESSSGLGKKLDYYSRCIRDAFDTTGWPDTTLWEQYLK